MNTSLKEILDSGVNVQLVINSNDLKECLVSLIDERISNITPHKQINEHSNNGLYGRRETASKLKVSVVTLDAWTNAGIINARRIGTKKYYTDKDIQDALKKVK